MKLLEMPAPNRTDRRAEYPVGALGINPCSVCGTMPTGVILVPEAPDDVESGMGITVILECKDHKQVQCGDAQIAMSLWNSK